MDFIGTGSFGFSFVIDFKELRLAFQILGPIKLDVAGFSFWIWMLCLVFQYWFLFFTRRLNSNGIISLHFRVWDFGGFSLDGLSFGWSFGGL